MLHACLLVREIFISVNYGQPNSSLGPDIIINLITCDRKTPQADKALEALKYACLAFSTVFMLELIASVWAFGTA